MLNHFTAMGRLTKNPELRQTGNGTKVASFSIAVDRDYSTGEEKVTDFINIVAWKERATFVERYFHKGDMMVVSGRLQSRTWEKDGEKHTAYEINAENIYFGQSKTTKAEQPIEQSWSETEDENLPF